MNVQNWVVRAGRPTYVPAMTEMTTAAPMALRGPDLKLARLAAWLCVAALVVGAAIALTGGSGRATVSSKRVSKTSLAVWRSLPAPAQAAVSRGLGRDLARFHATGVAGGFELVNSGVTARFDRAGAQLQAGGANVRLALSAIGYGASLRPLAGAAPHAHANRVVYSHPGVSEWYANGPAGLEHGFTLTRRPAGVRHSDLTLSLALSGATAARVDHNGLGATLRDGTHSLRYTGLWATDARGHKLPARLHTAGGQLRIAVDDHGAVYPITIDPFFQSARLSGADVGAGDQLGSTVAISGDTVVVGAPNSADADSTRPGAVYVFQRPATGWADAVQMAKLTASDGAIGDALGIAVAVDGDTIVAGAPGVGTYQGAVYVYSRPSGGWANATQTAKLTATDGGDYNYFGNTVAIEGSTIVAAAPYKNSGPTAAAGSVYVFSRPSGGWTNATQTAQLKASHPADGDGLGAALGLSGDTIVAGAPNIFAESNGEADVFTRPAGGWVNATETARLTASDGEIYDFLGGSVAISGDTIVLGAVNDAIGSNQYQGSAYVYVRPAGGWVTAPQTAKLTASDGADSDALGASVAIDGDTIIAGAPYDDVPGGVDQGSAYVFTRPASGWGNGTESSRLTVADRPGDDTEQYGGAVAVSGTTIVVGAQHSNDSRGLAYVENLDSTPPETTLVSGPPSLTNDNTPTFTFTSEPNAAFECRVDNGAFAACVSPFTTAALTDGDHTFEVRARDGAGNVDPTPSSQTFTVDTTAPETTISSGPAGLTNNNRPTFAFSSETGATFECRVDSGAFALCTSPSTTAALGDGAHTFQVRAVDLAGNKDGSPASRTFTVDATPPETTITGGPAAASTSTTPSFSFAASEPASTFQCSLDGAAYASCTSPHTTTVGGGLHTFSVRATDAAGNTDPTPATTSFRVCTGPLGGLGVLLNGLLPNSGLLCS